MIVLFVHIIPSIQRPFSYASKRWLICESLGQISESNSQASFLKLLISMPVPATISFTGLFLGILLATAKTPAGLDSSNLQLR